MKINIETKYVVGETVFAWMFGSYIPVEILGITIEVDNNNTKIKYEVDNNMIQVADENELFTEKELEEKSLVS
jgi:hypothetical protein